MKAVTLASLSLSSVALFGCMDQTSKNEPTAPTIAASRAPQSPCGYFEQFKNDEIQVTQPFCGNLVGNGEIVFSRAENPFLFPFSEEHYRVTLTAIHHNDGSVSGEYELNGHGARIHASITCVGTPAHQGQITAFTISGVVDQSTDQTLVGRDLGLFAAVPHRLSLPVVFPVQPSPFSSLGYVFPDVGHAFCAGMPVTSAGDFPNIQSEDVSVEIH